MAERTSQISFKITPELKAALETAAEADSRSVSSLVMMVLTEWAKTNGHLDAKPRKR
jgi:hypothetical protein